jgi:hypothetical protein
MKREWTKDETDRMTDALIERAGAKFISEVDAIEILQKRIAGLETALREIQEQLFSSWFSPDMVKQVVRKALEGKCGFSVEGRNE